MIIVCRGQKCEDRDDEWILNIARKKNGLERDPSCGRMPRILSAENKKEHGRWTALGGGSAPGNQIASNDHAIERRSAWSIPLLVGMRSVGVPLGYDWVARSHLNAAHLRDML